MSDITKSIISGDTVHIRAIVRETFADEAYVRIETGMKGLNCSVWVAREAIVHVEKKRETTP